MYCVRRRAPAHVLTLAPAVLVSAILMQSDSSHSGNSPNWRVTLSGLQFQLSPGQVIRFGGDARTDHVFVRGMPAGLLTLQQDADGALMLEQAVSGGGVVIVRDVAAAPGASDYEPQWGGIAIPPGVKFCRSDRPSCDTVGLSWVARKEQALLLDAGGRELCAFPIENPERAGELRIFTLAHYARAGCNDAQPFAWGRSQPAEEFLYWQGSGTARQLYLFPAAGVKYAIGRPEGGFTVRSARTHTLAGGEQRDLYFHRYVRQEPGAGVPGAARVGKIRDIRSFRVRHVPLEGSRDVRVEVFLHTPEATRVSLGPQALLTVTSKVANPATLAEGAAMAGFEVIGAPSAAELLNVLKLESGSRQFDNWRGQGAGCFEGATTVTVRGMSRVDCASAGRWFAIGDPQFLLAKVRVAALEVPSTWLFAIWMLALANLFLRDMLALSLGTRVVLVCLEILLALRLLVACDAAMVDPRQEGTVAAAWLALLCLPAAFELTARTQAPALQLRAARVLKSLLIVAGMVVIGVALGFGNVLAALRAAVEQDVGTVPMVLIGLCVALWALTRWAHPLTQWLDTQSSQWSTPNGAATLLLALAALHVAIALLGVREQIAGLRLSTLLVPLLVLAWGHWYVRMAQVAQTWRKVARAVAVAFAPLIGFVLARDNGAYVYFVALAVALLPLAGPWLAKHWQSALLIGVLLGAMLLAAFASLDSSFTTLLAVALGVAGVAVAGLLVLQRSGRMGLEPRAVWALPVGVALAGVLALHAGSFVLKANSNVSAAGQVQVADLNRIVGIEGNSIRLLDLIAPRTVEGLGLRQGYEQRAAMSEMFAYAATLTGRGWPSTAIPRELRLTHVDDAVAAVHLMAPFGRLAAFGLTGFLAAFALGSATLLRGRADIAAQQARLAIAVLVTVSLYMLFANIGVVPFTGRNFYFLSVASNSDLLEGGLLLAIVAAGLASVPPQERS